MVDTSRIRTLVSQGRRRLKFQSALETATLSLILASAVALAAVYAVRRLWLSETLGIVLLAGAGALIAVGLLIGYVRRFSTSVVATRIDRASGLCDRLANACEFEERLRVSDLKADKETIAMMRIAVADAVRNVPKANVKAATPFALPKDWRPALAFTAASALVAGLYIAPPEVEPLIGQVIPNAAPAGATVEITGTRFCGADDDSMRSDGTCDSDVAGTVLIGVPPQTAGTAGTTPETTNDDLELVYIEGGPYVEGVVLSWRHRTIDFRVPKGTPIGKTIVRVKRGKHLSNKFEFEVLDPKDERALPKDAVVFDEDDQDFQQDLIDDLRATADKTEDPHLKEFVNEIEDLVQKAKDGAISKQELLEKLAKAEEKYMEGSDEDLEEHLSELKKTGKELQKDKLTKELGKALEQADMEKAQQEMEKLAQKMENGEMSEKEMEKLAKSLEKAAEKFEKRQEQKDKKLDQQIAKEKQKLERMKKQAEHEKDERKKNELTRQMERKQRQLDKLQRKKQERQKSAMQRHLKSLHRNMKKSADNMNDKQQSQQQRKRFASENMRNMKKDSGKVQDERRKITNQKKVASQMSDLKEAMRRAKRKGKGMGNRFGKNARNDDFRRRARGQKGQKSAWKPGSTGQGKGQGQGKNGQGKGKGGKQWGTGHDDDLMGQETPKGGHVKDPDVQGVQGKAGSSTRETILSAAQTGFSTRAYKDVYARYKNVVEEVIKAEKVPSGYKYYVKKYFQKIKPHQM